MVSIKEMDKVLDAGCGEGILANYARGKNLYGFDLSKKAVQKAREKNYAKVIQSEIYETPFKNKEFDQTFSIGVFQYLENPNKAFKELTRLTKKEIIITVSNFNWFKIKMFFSKKWRKIYGHELKHHSNFTNADFLKQLAKKNRLNVKIKFISSRFGLVRNLLGDWLASEVVGIYSLQPQ